MKDLKDLQTADLALPPKLGRPRSGNALSNSEKQKAYRNRNKAVGKKPLLFTRSELWMLHALCAQSNHDHPNVGAADAVRALLDKLNFALHGEAE